MTGTGIEATVREGAQSQFDVVVDGATVFSRQQAGRFPAPGEIAGRLLEAG